MVIIGGSLVLFAVSSLLSGVLSGPTSLDITPLNARDEDDPGGPWVPSKRDGSSSVSKTLSIFYVSKGDMVQAPNVATWQFFQGPAKHKVDPCGTWPANDIWKQKSPGAHLDNPLVYAAPSEQPEHISNSFPVSIDLDWPNTLLNPDTAKLSCTLVGLDQTGDDGALAWLKCPGNNDIKCVFDIRGADYCQMGQYHAIKKQAYTYCDW